MAPPEPPLAGTRFFSSPLFLAGRCLFLAEMELRAAPWCMLVRGWFDGRCEPGAGVLSEQHVARIYHVQGGTVSAATWPPRRLLNKDIFFCSPFSLISMRRWQPCSAAAARGARRGDEGEGLLGAGIHPFLLQRRLSE